MVQQIKGLDTRIKYSKIPDHTMFITFFADASLNNLPDKTSSAFGYLLFLSNDFSAGMRNTCNIIGWKANKIRRKVNLTYDAEALALADALEEAVVLKDQLMKITSLPKELILIEAYSDYQDVVSSINSSKQNHRGGRTKIDSARMREMLEDGTVHSIQLISTNLQLADCLTKKGATKTALIQTVENGKFFNQIKAFPFAKFQSFQPKVTNLKILQN